MIQHLYLTKYIGYIYLIGFFFVTYMTKLDPDYFSQWHRDNTDMSQWATH